MDPELEDSQLQERDLVTTQAFPAMLQTACPQSSTKHPSPREATAAAHISQDTENEKELVEHYDSEFEEPSPRQSSAAELDENGDEDMNQQSQTPPNDSFMDESSKCSPIPTEPEQDSAKEEPSAVEEDLQSEMAESGRHQTEPDVGAEAPSGWAENPSDLEEAFDDVEFPEAVVLVGKTHWRCVTCMAYYSRATSIDHHMRIYHKQQATPPKRGRGRGFSRPAGRPPGRTSTPGRPSTRAASVGRGAPAGRSQRKAQNEIVIPKVGRGRQPVRRPRGRGVRGSRGAGRGGRGGRGRGGRGRGRNLFSRKLDDSDTEPEYTPTVQPKSPLVRKRKTRTSRSSLGMNSEGSDAAPPTKILKQDESVSVSIEEDLVESQVSDAQDKSKEMFKDKYLVVVEKAGSAGHLSEVEALADDHALPIETPSLQADSLLPPATPVLPEIHGPPETPLLPETPHHPDTFHPPGTPAALETLAGAESTDNQFPPAPPQTSDVPTHEMPGDSASTDVHTNPLAAETQGDTEDHHRIDDTEYTGTSTAVNRTASVSVSCRTCHSLFKSQAELKSHLSEVSRFDTVLCNECGDKFHGVHQLNMHVFNFHEKSAKKFCFVCGTDFPDSFELEEHLLEHTLEEPEKGKDIDDSDFISHVCKVCSVEVEGNLSDLMNHYHTTHDQFICTTCYECFADMTAYQDHKLSHMADSSESSEPVVFTCPVSDCFQMCEDKEALRDHISWHEDQDMGEEEITTLACTQCSGEFRNKMSLHRHLAEVHSVPNIKPFICELCNEEFSQSLDLHRHNTLNHAGIKRYGCAYCSQRFAFRSSYRRHVASQHDVAATILRI